MNEYKIDLHIHTNVNPHAFSTLEENVRASVKKGMKVIAITNHGPELQDTPHWWHLSNITILPEIIDGVRVLKGVEANILPDGNLDVSDKICRDLDIILAGFHTIDRYGDTYDIEKNTTALTRVMETQKADIIVHLGNPMFPIDYEKIVRLAKEKNIALELNNTSLSGKARVGSESNCEKMLKLAKEIGCFISLGTDSHFSGHIGGFDRVVELLNKVGYPEELIINSSEEVLENFLNLRKKLKDERR